MQDQIQDMKGCSQWGKDRQCIYTKEIHKDNRFRNDNWKTAPTGTLSLYSAIWRCALYVLGRIGAEVAWHVAFRSLPCHMGTSYLAGLTEN